MKRGLSLNYYTYNLNECVVGGRHPLAWTLVSDTRPKERELPKYLGCYDNH